MTTTSTPITSATGSAYVSSQQADSKLGTYSARWAIPAGTSVVNIDPNSMVMTVGRFYVWTVAARWISGDATIQISQARGATLSQALPKGSDFGWGTFGGVGKYMASAGDNRVALRVNNDGTTSTVIQTDHFQVVSFASLSEALEWYNSGVCLSK